MILKIHGAVDRVDDGRRHSYVITEDHYIEYLAHAQRVEAHSRRS